MNFGALGSDTPNIAVWCWAVQPALMQPGIWVTYLSTAAFLAGNLISASSEFFLAVFSAYRQAYN